MSVQQSVCKENLEYDTCMIQMDFAENFAFLCQDSTQGYYYNNTQATIHPFVIYYKDQVDNQLKSESFCIISNDMKHTAVTVNTFQEKVLDKLKDLCPWIRNVIYISDGAPTQYKNK